MIKDEKIVAVRLLLPRHYVQWLLELAEETGIPKSRLFEWMFESRWECFVGRCSEDAPLYEAANYVNSRRELNFHPDRPAPAWLERNFSEADAEPTEITAFVERGVWRQLLQAIWRLERSGVPLTLTEAVALLFSWGRRSFEEEVRESIRSCDLGRKVPVGSTR